MQALLEILYTNNLSKSYKEPVRYTSAALCAVGTSVTLHYLRSLRDSVCLLYKTFSLSLHISEEPLTTLLPCLPLPCYHVFHYPVSSLPLPCYHVLNTLLPCLLLFCTMSYITLLPCLPLLCYHVSYYPVPCLPLLCLMSSITLSHQGMQNHKKRVDKLIIPRTIPLKTINLSTRLLVYSST